MSSPNQLSFLPDDYLETKRQRRTNVICAALFLAIMSGIGVGFTTVEKSLRQAEKEHDDVVKEYADAATKIQQQKQMQEKHQRLNAQAELTASLVEKVPRSRLLAELTNAKPAGVTFKDVVLDSKVRTGPPAGPKSQFELKREAMAAATGIGGKPAAAPVPQAKNYDVTVKVTGRADNDVQVAQFMAKLNQSQLVQDVNLLVSDEELVGEVRMRQFQIEMTVNPNAEIALAPAAAPMRQTSTAVELKQ
jgi:Tfp pilus assembly protein PilN